MPSATAAVERRGEAAGDGLEMFLLVSLVTGNGSDDAGDGSGSSGVDTATSRSGDAQWTVQSTRAPVRECKLGDDGEGGPKLQKLQLAQVMAGRQHTFPGRRRCRQNAHKQRNSELLKSHWHAGSNRHNARTSHVQTDTHTH